MNQTNSSLTGNTDSDLMQESRDQQEQINSLAGSLEDVLAFLQNQKDQDGLAISDLSEVTEESIKYLSVIVNNLNLLREENEKIKSGMINLNGKLEASIKKQTDEFKDLKSVGISLRQEQSESKDSLIGIKNLFNSQQSFLNKVLSWKSLAIAVTGLCLTNTVTTAIITENTVSKLYENDIAVFGRLKRIDEYLGVKKK
jgi:hypothetical protein